MVVRLPVAEDHTPTIIDADLDPDVVVPDAESGDGPTGDGSAGRDAEVHP
jgi:hypothetical protein